MTKQEINTAFKKTGLKKGFVAGKLGISQVYLSQIISGVKSASKKRAELENFLQHKIKKAA